MIKVIVCIGSSCHIKGSRQVVEGLQYLINEHGQIEARKVGEEYFPLPIQSLFVGDKIHGGLQEPDSNSLQFSFAPNYSDDLVIVTPEFNAVTDL